METEKMGELYQKIAEQLNVIIPSEWERVSPHSQVVIRNSLKSN